MALLTGVVLAAAGGVQVPVWLMPLELLTVVVHEGAHAAVALLTGAEVLSVDVTPSGGGSTHTTGGIPPLILLVGYPGAMWTGVATLVASRWSTPAAALITLAGVSLCLLALIWDAPWRHPALFLVVLSAVSLAWGWPPAARFLGRVLGTFLFSRALVDVVADAWLLPPDTATDAAVLAAGTGIPAAVWSLAWVISGVAVLVAGVRSWGRGPDTKAAA